MAGLDCNYFISDGRYQCQGEVLNSPPWYPGTGYGHFFVDVYHHADSWIVQVAHAVDHIGSFIRHCIGGTWQEWEKIATTTPPQQFDLPMAEGLIQSSASWYSKDQFGQVHVHGAISAGSGSLGWDMLVATLPEGYRPSAKIEAAATFASSGTNGSGAVAVYADGTIKVFPDISAAQKVVYFDLFFSAD